MITRLALVVIKAHFLLGTITALALVFYVTPAEAARAVDITMDRVFQGIEHGEEFI